MGFFSFGSKAPLPKAQVRCGMYREPASQVHLSGSAVIQDNGLLRRTAAASNGNFLFSEVGAGVMPMVLIGMKQEIMIWLDRSKSTGIENRIGELPEIYASVQPYTPGARFKGLFPMHDAIQAVTEGIASFAPGSTLTDLVGAAKDIKGAWEFSNGGMKIFHSSSVPKVDYSGILYCRFHYLGGKDMHQIGRDFISFGDLKILLQQMMR